MPSKPDDESDPAIMRRAERLKEIVNLAGGPAVVARRINMPVPTLNNYLAGRDMKASALISLAEACKASLEWLATGRGSMQPDHSSGPPLEGFSIESLGFNREQLDDAGNFWALFTLTRSCQEWYEKSGITPTLHNILKWVGALYGNFSGLPDLPVEFMSPEESLALRNARLSEGK